MSAPAETAVRNLHHELVAAEIAADLHGRGIPSILLKGPSTARWLHPPEARRRYADIDLLVPPALLLDAEEVLRLLGYVPKAPTPAARSWRRRDGGAFVDLHRTLPCVGAAPETVWRVLSQSTGSMTVGGSKVTVLSPAARAFHVALHAAQHGVYTRPLRDLSAAVSRVPEAVWRNAVGTAQRLDAVPAFAAGLRLLPEGCALAERLGLSPRTTVELVLRGRELAPAQRRGGLWIQRLVATPGVGSKLRFATSRLWPEPTEMRSRYRIAGRGRAGLAAAYVVRALTLSGGTAPGLLGWARARRRASRSRRHT